jgi:UDPglucose 6-dehydrogenase/UDP-N-acetyl-D-galactosamine dehydrogenase
MITTVYEARDIRTAEAAKVIENVHRDLNIALVNELSLIFGKMGLSTSDVLEAAGTKWNFHRYSPGLVGGHSHPCGSVLSRAQGSGSSGLPSAGDPCRAGDQ